MGNSWLGGNGHDEDSDDRLIDQMGRTHRQGPPPPPNRGGRSCALLLIAGAGGLAALGMAVAEGVSRLT